MSEVQHQSVNCLGYTYERCYRTWPVCSGL